MSDNYDQEVMTPINYNHKKFRAAMNNIKCTREDKPATEISGSGNELLTPLYTRPMQNEPMYIEEENNDEDSYGSYEMNNSNNYDVYMIQAFPLDLSMRPRFTSTPIRQQNKDVEQAYKMEYISDYYKLVGTYERPLRPGALLDLNMVHESYIAPLTVDVGDEMDLMEEINAFMNSATLSLSDYSNENQEDKSKNDLDDSERKEVVEVENAIELEHKESDTEITDDVKEAALILLRMKKGIWKRSQSGDMDDQEPPQKKCKLE